MSEVVNAMTVTVTADDIRRGRPGHPLLCPVAIAIARAARKDVVVSSLMAHIGSAKILLPASAAQFVYDFDFSKPVDPFSFELEAGS